MSDGSSIAIVLLLIVLGLVVQSLWLLRWARWRRPTTGVRAVSSGRRVEPAVTRVRTLAARVAAVWSAVPGV